VEFGCRRSPEEPSEQVTVLSSFQERREALRELSLDEVVRPVCRSVTDVEVDMMHFDVAPMMSDDLGHGPRSRHHERLSIPERGIEVVPRSFEETERVLDLYAKGSGGAACALISSLVGVVPVRVEPANLAG
jgi:hypothetical protein